MESSLKQEIDAVDQKFMDLFKAADFTGIGNLCTEDCKVMPTGSPLLQGREAMVKMVKGIFDSGPKSMKLVEGEIGEAGGDVAYSRGSYTLFLADGSVADEGKYVDAFNN